MRLVMSIVVVILAGCAPSPRRLVQPEAVRAVDELIEAHPLAAAAPIRADVLAKVPAATVHLVQLRGSEVPHVHAAHDLVVTVMRGEGVLTMAGRARPMRAGDVAVVPRGTPHWFAPRGGDPAVALAVFAPPLGAPDVVAVDDVDSVEAPR